MMSVLVEFDKGTIGNMHKHPHEQLTFMLEGEFDFTTGEEKHICKTGNTLYKEVNIMHGCVVCLMNGKLLDTFTSQREDFLKK